MHAFDSTEIGSGMIIFHGLAILNVHKNDNFFGFDFEICTISLLVMLKYKVLYKNFLIGPLLGDLRFFRLVSD